MTIAEQCKALREMIIKQKQQEQHIKNMKSGNDQLFIVVLLSNLKRMGESALRWSFFTLNAFILTLYLCSTITNI